jgi:hypothetical protein
VRSLNRASEKIDWLRKTHQFYEIGIVCEGKKAQKWRIPTKGQGKRANNYFKPLHFSLSKACVKDCVKSGLVHPKLCQVREKPLLLRIVLYFCSLAPPTPAKKTTQAQELLQKKKITVGIFGFAPRKTKKKK